jgi:flagellar basal-body rod protein FlgB
MQVTSLLSSELERYLDLSSTQLKVTSMNMANIDTPGYRTQGFDFATEMQQAMSGQQGAYAGPKIASVDGLLERPDGNNVSIDREGLKMAEAQLQFRTGVEILRHEFSRIENAIQDVK